MSQTKKPAKSIEDNVMNQISSGDVKMKSKAHFVILNAILIASASLFTVLSAVFLSMSVRDVRLGRELALGEFGSRGEQEFLASLPWLMAGFGVIAVGAALLLVKHFEFSYRHKTTVIIATVLLAVLGLAGITSASGLHDKLAGAPPFKPLNTLQKVADEHRIYGWVQEVGEDYLSVKLPEGKIMKVKINEATKYARNNPPVAGDKVVIFGDINGGEYDFKAYGIRKGEPRVRGDILDMKLKEKSGEIKGWQKRY
ncbi:MAG: hypothetical protein R3313_00435 [Candidatus Saccharimonadales bacterium]|nr:hypothetical protein [Candidatus Saccharimonadales bacterium]